MTPKINGIYTGTVKNIRPYGAFVEISDPENPSDKVTGMVHISEISNEYVKEIGDVLTVGQTVKVKVLGERDGKYSFSIKKAEVANEQKKSDFAKQPKYSQHSQHSQYSQHSQRNGGKRNNFDDGGESGDPSFEAMMSHFKKISDDKISDFNRNRDRRNKSYRSR